ncbi:MAG: hypothetical protein P8Z36_12200 [Gemmatimonadota bacterium]
MLRSIRVLSAVFVLLLCAGHATAQEVQVPLDSAGRIDEIDARLARRLGLFLDRYPDMVVVRLFQQSDSTYVLEVTSRRDGRTVRQRVPMTGAQVAELQADVSRRVAAEAPEAALNQEGRSLLLATTTTLGLGYYGWAVPVTLDINDGRAAVATYMFTAGASFIVPYLLTKTRPVTYGMANLGYWGATRGVAHGVLLGSILSDDDRVPTGLGMAASIVEATLDYAWAAHADMSPGTAHDIGNMGDFGGITGVELALLVDAEDADAVNGLMLAGSLLGVPIGAGYADARHHTWGDAEIQRMAYGTGILAGLMVYDWIDGMDNPRVVGASMLAGSSAAFVIADHALRNVDYTVGQGVLVDLGTVAGALIGLGTAALVSDNEGLAQGAALTLTTAGALAGLGLTAASLKASAYAPATPSDGMKLSVSALPGRSPGAARGSFTPMVVVSLRF